MSLYGKSGGEFAEDVKDIGYWQSHDILVTAAQRPLSKDEVEIYLVVKEKIASFQKPGSAPGNAVKTNAVSRRPRSLADEFLDF